MQTGTTTVDESTSATDATDIDLRDRDYQSLLADPPPPPPTSATDGPITLGSLAFRLFDTIENQIARDPHGATLTAMAGRLEALERAAVAAAAQTEALTSLELRLDDLEGQMAAPDPVEAELTVVKDRLAAAEHQLAAPHPHTSTINSLVERVDEVEAKGTPRNINAFAERLDIVERHTPSQEVITQMTDRLVAIERRMTAPEEIGRLSSRLDALERRFSRLPDPSEKRRLSGKGLFWLFVVVTVLAVAAAVGVLALG